jgi:hypothetical protein
MKFGFFSGKQKNIALILIFILGIYSAYAGGDRWTITTVDIVTEGSTRESVLRRMLDIQVGREFESLEDLQIYLDGKREYLEGIRLFQSASLDYKVVETDENVFSVSVFVYTKDTWNIIALPYPRYDSNSGLRLSIKFRNYNAFGSMEPLNIDLDYELSTAGESTLGTSLAFTAPLSWQRESWELITSQSFLYSFSEPFSYEGFTSIRKIFDRPGYSSYIQLRQGFIDMDLDDDSYSEWYLRTEVGAYARAPIFPNFMKGTGYASGNLVVGVNYNSEEALPSDYSGADAKLSTSLGFGRVDWIGNFRQGWLTTAENTLDYRFEANELTNLLTATFRIDVPLIEKILGAGIRIVGMAAYPDPLDDLGVYLRGIRNDGIESDLGAFANFSLAMKLFDFLPSKYISKSWLDMEVQGSIFFDAGLVKEPITEIPELYMSSGAEFFAFPRAARSMFARISAGFDILHYAESANLASALEVFFGLGSHY